MTDIETHYEAYDGELLAIVEIFKHWWHYLEGSKYPVIVKSNHANLQAFMDPKMKRLNRCQARWAEMLTAFNFIIKHHPGTSNPADVLSWRPDYKPIEGEVLEDTLLLTLQEKLSCGLIKPEEWLNIPLELRPLTVSMMMCSKKAAQTEKQDVNEASICLGD